MFARRKFNRHALHVAAIWMALAGGAHAGSCPIPSTLPASAKPDVRTGHERRYEPLLRKIQQLAKQQPFYAIGIGDSNMQLWPQDLLDSVFGRWVLNAGVGGDAAPAMLWRLENVDWSRQSPRYVLVSLGRNDLVRNSVCDSFIGVRAAVMKTKEKFPNAKIVYISMLPRGEGMAEQREEIEALNREIKSSAAQWGIGYLDVYDAFRCGGVTPCDLMIPPRNSHPTRKGFILLSDLLKKHLGSADAAP
jgi:lysophospholipase L1-like esterase